MKSKDAVMHGVLVPTETLREVRDAIGFFTQSCERGNLAADADRIYKAMRQVVPKLTEIEAKNES